MDIYDLAIKLSLVNGVSGGLTMIVNQFTSLRVNIRNTQTVLQTFQAALGASWEWHAGRTMLRGMKDVLASGGEILDQQALMLAAGWKQADVVQMTAAAYRTAASVMAATPASALAAERTLLGIFGDVREAQAGLTAFLQTEAVMTAAGRGAGAERQLAYGLKALDIQGAFVDRETGEFSVSAYKAGMHELTALMLAIPHTLDMNQLMLFTRMAGPAAQAMSFEDYARTYGEVIASMGRTGGRGLQMLYKTFLGGNVSKALADELIRAGLVKPGAIRHIKGSSRDILDYHGIVGWQELTTNAADWAHDVLFPMLAKHGFKGVPGMMQAMGSLPVTVQRLLSFLLTNWAQVERSKQTIERAEKADSYDVSVANSWSLNVRNFEAAWQGLMQALGDPAAAFALPMLRDLSGDIKFLTRVLEDNPDVAGILDEIVVSLGAILTMRGLGTGLRILKMLAGAQGLGGLAQGLGLFGAGTIGAAGLKVLTGPTGLFALAIGFDALGKALPSIPKWLTHFASKQAMDIAVAKLLHLPGALGLVMDLGGDTNQRWLREHPPSAAVVQSTVDYYRSHHMSLPKWLTDLQKAGAQTAGAAGNIYGLPVPLPSGALRLPPLPLPPIPPRQAASNVQVTLHSPISLPIPPLSEPDIESMFRSAIYSHNAALLHELAAAIVRQQRNDLMPAIQDAINRMQTQQHRQTFHDHGRAAIGFAGL